MRVNLASVILAISFIPTLNGGLPGSLIKKFIDLADPPDSQKLIETQEKIKEIQFRKYSENVFHDSGRGVKEGKWGKMAEVMGRLYNIPPSGVELLKTAEDVEEIEKNVHNFDMGGKEPGTFGYMRIAIEKGENGDLSYIIAGTQIKFTLAPAQPDKKTTQDLYFMKFEGVEETEAILPKQMEESLEDYFINKALVAAEKRYGKVLKEPQTKEL